jgi:uncharacterized membrane protein
MPADMADAPPAAGAGTGPAALARWRRAVAGTHLVVSVLAGVAAGAAAALARGWGLAPLIAWVVAAAVFLTWIWASIWSLPAPDTAWLAQREDGSRGIRDLVLLGISVGTLLTVAMVIFRAHQNPPARTALGAACVVASWLVLNTVFTLRYARLYYTEPAGGIDFNQEDRPTYRDFAYVAFTIGMTFQVSDTSLGRTEIRATALRHAVTSFVFDAVIIAVTVNVVAGLSS